MTDTERRAAVMGAAGFIGHALTGALQARGIPVAGYTRATPFLDATGRLSPGARAADTVFWLASSIRPATASDHADAAAADERALSRLLDALGTEGNPRARVVVVSSGGTVYDSTHPSPHAESAPLAPANEYGAAMLRIESLVADRAPQPVVIRVSNAYGPGQPARRGQGVIAHWLSAIAGGEPIHVLGRDDVARDYVFIDDVIDALIRVHASEEVPSVVNVGSGVPTTLRTLLDHVRDTVAPRGVDAHHDPGRSFDAPSNWLDVSLAAEELGWKPATDLPGGLTRTWQHVASTDRGNA
ncbi:MAG TPA: NAD-dependent epimerase/dehydratase family protein [Jatrophihabitantaceae bacterium]|nr:NAD-dependent epimerase/dehydratase family protein [Jatrophihabitantaceae bacterium]